MPWEKYVYKFVLFSLCVGLIATVVRFALVLTSGSGDIIERVGGPVAIVVDGSLAFILWRKPHSLRFVEIVIYLFMTVGIGAKLVYFLYSGETGTYSQFVQISPWMSVNYLLPFFIFGSRLGTRISSSVFGFWVIISGWYVFLHHGTAQSNEVAIIFTQTYLAQCILIVFVALYTRLQALYFVAQKSVLRMERMASTDFLLGIANRRFTHNELSKQIEYAEKLQSTLSVILIDIDRFKQINDTHGHHIGDVILVEFSSLLQKMIEEPNFFGRWGGEEFLAIWPNCSKIQANDWAERIRETLETHQFPIGQVTATFGIAQYNLGDSSHSLLKRADIALYKGKQMGRNRVEVS